ADVGARVVVETAVVGLPHGLAAAGHVPRKTETRAHRLQIRHRRRAGGHGRKVRRLFRREALFGPSDFVAIESDAGVHGETTCEVPAVLHVDTGRRGVVYSLIRSVVDVDLGRRCAVVAVVDVPWFEAQELPPLAIGLEAELEVMAAG